MSTMGSLHHVELRTSDLAKAEASWGWLLSELGYTPFQRWEAGRSWKLEGTYIVLESAPLPGPNDRRLAGLSHLAFHAGGQENVDRLWREAPAHGWSGLYADRHPWAGGEPTSNDPGQYAAFLENEERFKIELVAAPKAIR
jgi:catechol 2,3-dioxygenase-like lactoylglutathione lyase family enzyme